MFRLSPDFSALDALYVDAPGSYVHLLSRMYLAYQGHKEALLKAYRLRHTSQFRRIKHQITSLLRLLDCDALVKELEQLTEALVAHRSTKVSNALAKQYLEELLSAMQSKQKALTLSPKKP